MTDSPTEHAEQAATRRRWISLAEFVAVAGLLIGGATLYLNWSDARADEAAKAAAAVTAGKARTIATLAGTVAEGGDSLILADAAHSFSAATIRFPDALGVQPQDAMPGPAIRADWIARPLLALTDDGADTRQGRVPALITVEWWDGDTRQRDTALYDVLWRTEGRLLQGRRLLLTGLTLRERNPGPGALDTAWAGASRGLR